MNYGRQKIESGKQKERKGIMLGIIGKVLSIVTDTFGVTSSAGKAIETVKKAITSNPEIEKQIAELEMKERESIRDLFKAEMQSEDSFVRRVRPGALWVAVGVIAINFGLLPIVNTIITAFGVTAIVINYPALPEPIYYLIGTMYLGYSTARSYDKDKRKNGK